MRWGAPKVCKIFYLAILYSQVGSHEPLINIVHVANTNEN